MPPAPAQHRSERRDRRSAGALAHRSADSTAYAAGGHGLASRDRPHPLGDSSRGLPAVADLDDLLARAGSANGLDAPDSADAAPASADHAVDPLPAADDRGARPAVGGAALVLVVALIGLYKTRDYSYLLFHSIAELFFIVIACGIFVVTWNARRLHRSPFLTLLGVAYLSVSVVNLLHLLAFRGMGVFPPPPPGESPANLATQLWVAGRSLQAVSVFAAALLLGTSAESMLTGRSRAASRRTGQERASDLRGLLPSGPVLAALYAAVTALLLTAIFRWRAFPTCYDADGLTLFKKAAEFANCGLLAAAAVVLYRRRACFDREVGLLLVAGVGVAVLQGLAFTMYVDPYNLWNWTGHCLQLVSTTLVYQAIVVTALDRPYALVLRGLKQNDLALRDAHAAAERERASADDARHAAEFARQVAEEARAAAEKASRAKDQFLAVLSHELRNPLNPVLVAASALERDESLPELVRDDLSLIRRNVELEAKLIDDLLDLTRVSKGKLVLDKRPTDVHALLRQAAEICQPDADEKGLKIALTLGADRPVCDADPARLLQVFWNVVKNAVKFSRDGGTVLIRTADETGAAHRGGKGERSATKAPAGVLRVEVVDEGMGIEPAALSRIFDAFQQGGEGVNRQFGGLGLGLAISRALVERHGGSIGAGSDGAGRGATFRVDLPVAPAGVRPVDAPRPTAPFARSAALSSRPASRAPTAPELPAPDPAAPDPAAPVERLAASQDRLSALEARLASRKSRHRVDGPTPTATTTRPARNGPPAAPCPSDGPRVLLVEDHADTARLMSRLLRGKGYRVTVADCLAAGRSAFGDAASAGEPFDLLLSDLGLPDGSGLDLMRELKARDPSLPGVCLSGFGMDHDQRAARDAGFAAHLTKPVDFPRLLEALREVAPDREPIPA